MSIEYRRLTDKELDTFIEMRTNQLREEGSKDYIYGILASDLTE